MPALGGEPGWQQTSTSQFSFSENFDLLPRILANSNFYHIHFC
jgi:hypothetical protein